MNASSRAVFGWAAAVSLLVSMAVSWRILALRPAPGDGSDGAGRPGLLAAIARRPDFALGFRNFLADVAWLQAVQVAGTLRMAPSDYDRLHGLLNVVADFDGRFEIPYLLGGLVLGSSPDHGNEALQVLGRGKAQYPANWKFPFYMGFTHYFSLGDPVTAGKEMMAASLLPGSPGYIPGLASRMMSEAGDPEAALSMLAAVAALEGDPDRRAVLERRMREVIVERDLQLLENAVAAYRERTGTDPRALSDLVRSGILRRIPEEPNGGTYLLEAGGNVRSDRIAHRLKVFRKK